MRSQRGGPTRLKTIHFSVAGVPMEGRIAAGALWWARLKPPVAERLPKQRLRLAREWPGVPKFRQKARTKLLRLTAFDL